MCLYFLVLLQKSTGLSLERLNYSLENCWCKKVVLNDRWSLIREVAQNRFWFYCVWFTYFLCVNGGFCSLGILVCVPWPFQFLFHVPQYSYPLWYKICQCNLLCRGISFIVQCAEYCSLSKTAKIFVLVPAEAELFRLLWFPNLSRYLMSRTLGRFGGPARSSRILVYPVLTVQE